MNKQTQIQAQTDEHLAREYRQNPEPAILGELYKRHTQFVFLVSMKYFKDPIRCEDNVMRVFEKLAKELKNQDLKNFKAWLHVVTRNECLMQLRGDQSELKKFQAYKNYEESVVEFEPELHHKGKYEDEKRFETLQEAVKSLKPEQQQCVELFYLQEKSYVEVAEITGFELKKVKSYIQNGKRNLKIYLENAGISMPVVIFILSQLA